MCLYAKYEASQQAISLAWQKDKTGSLGLSKDLKINKFKKNPPSTIVPRNGI